MKNNNEHIFSEEYIKKREAMLRSIKKAQTSEHAVGVRMPARMLIVAVAVCIMLSVTAFAAAKLGVFNIQREETKTVIQIGDADSVATDDTVINKGNYITIPSSYEERGEIPRLIFHRDYMPASVKDGENGTEIKVGDFENGDSLSFNVVYLGGEGFVCNLGVGAEIEELEVNGHDALIIRRGETVHFNRILTVYFEDEDVLAMCYIGYSISDEEVVKIAEGLRLEKTEDETLAYPIVHNYGHMNLAESFSNLPEYLPLTTAEKTQLGYKMVLSDTVFKQDGPEDMTALTADVEITPTDIKVLDDMSSLDITDLREDFAEYIDADGEFISYPRTEVIKNDGEAVGRFGETEYVKKKLVMVELKLKNTADEAVYSYTVGDIQLHVGHEGDICSNYVYDSTPQKESTTPLVSYYDAGSDGRSFYKTELGAGEEITCHIGFLVDEDMLDEAYLLFGDVSGRRYSLKVTE